MKRLLLTATICLGFLISVPSKSYATGKLAIDLLAEKYSSLYIKSSKGKSLFRGILRVESNDGEMIESNLPVPTYGISQMRPIAVREAARYWKLTVPDTDTSIIRGLLTSNAFSIKMGAAYFGYLLSLFKDPYVATVAYNIGPSRTRKLLANGSSLPQVYLQKVLSKSPV